MQVCTSCRSVHHAGLYIMQVCTSCRSAHHAGLHIMQVCTSCRSAHYTWNRLQMTVCREDIRIFVCMSLHVDIIQQRQGCSNDGHGFCLSAITLTGITVFASSSRQAAEHLLKKKRMCMMPHCRNFFCVSRVYD